MKNIYTLLIVAATAMANAQQTISFEANEGFQLGNLHNQNGWEVTEGKTGIITNQLITDEQASEGKYSFKNGNQDDFDPQWFPIFGSSKTFDTPLNYKDFTISFDAYVNKRMGADFEFSLFTINPTTNEFYPVAGFGLENRGEFYITTSTEYDFTYADLAKDWKINQWHHFDIKVSENEIKYYMNGLLIYTGENFTQLDVHGFTILHNNYGGDAYYDNFKINAPKLGITEIETNNLQLYPNPVKDYLTIQGDFREQIASIELINSIGQLVFQTKNNLDKISTNQLQAGIYFAKIKLKNGQVIQRKIIKK